MVSIEINILLAIRPISNTLVYSFFLQAFYDKFSLNAFVSCISRRQSNYCVWVNSHSVSMHEYKLEFRSFFLAASFA